MKVGHLIIGIVWLGLSVGAVITSAPSIVFWTFLIIANIYIAKATE